tara:strand:- start:615 stop:1325 length:711 start_codon:yes stop_codon:yes gene_type:complete
MTKQLRAGIIYQGPSQIDGLPIVAIATYSDRNTKTGKVLQTYIIRSDISPLDASKSGQDFSICGDCKFRGEANSDLERKQAKNRKCYVNLGQGPTIVYKSFNRGVYPMASDHTSIVELGKNRVVRLGTYGDPAAIPSHIWDQLLSECISHLAYSHQSGFRPDITMQSADTLAQAQAHWAKRARTFRVIDSIDEIDKANEILCPASKEAGRRVQCVKCQLCSGLTSNSKKSIAIVEH